MLARADSVLNQLEQAAQELKSVTARLGRSPAAQMAKELESLPQLREAYAAAMQPKLEAELAHRKFEAEQRLEELKWGILGKLAEAAVNLPPELLAQIVGRVAP